jgi:hypothetical protein
MATDLFHETDVSAWPMVVVKLNRAPHNSEELHQFEEDFLAMLRVARDGFGDVASTSLTLLFFLDGLIDANFEHQLSSIGFVKRVQQEAPDTVKVTALIASNDLVVQLLDCVLAAVPLHSVNRVFGNEHEARAWLQRETQALGLLPV